MTTTLVLNIEKARAHPNFYAIIFLCLKKSDVLLAFSSDSHKHTSANELRHYIGMRADRLN